jgi:Tfp pilus assembly protein PilF
MSSGDFKGAEEKIKVLLEKAPDEILYNGLLAEVYRLMGEKNKATEIYEKLLQNDSENPQTLLSLSDFLITEKEYDELFNVLNIIVINSKITREDKISLITRLIENDELVRIKGQNLEMIILVLEATYRNDSIIYLLRPELYQKQQEIQKAIDRLEEIVDMNPENYYAWEKLLILYSETGDYNNLLIRGKECATKFNMSYPAKVLYANAALEKGEFNIAQEELRKAKIIAGENKEMIVQVLTMEADLYYRKREFSKSYETFKEALKLSPEDIIILNNYAYYLAEQGEELKEAERMAKKVIEKEKNNGTYLDTYAWVLYKIGKIKEAARIMEEIIAKGDKEDADWCEHYGFIMKAMKKCDKAVEYWKQAKSLDIRKNYLDKEIQNCSK